MGQKINPMLHQDLTIRSFLMGELKNASVSRIVIERPHKTCRITIYTARPGVVIGKKGADIEVLRKKVAAMVDGEVFINLIEVRKPEVDANLVADGIAQQLERRVSFRRAMKRSLQSAMRMGAKGCKIKLGGRLGGAEIARVEQYQEGSVPLHTMRADIDYGTARAMTAMGIIGIKVWINKGEIMEHDPYAHEKRLADQGSERSRGGDRNRNDRQGGRRPARSN